MMASEESTQLELTDAQIGEDLYPIEPLVEAVESGARHVQLQGLTGAFRACVLADLSRRTNRPLFIVDGSSRDSERLANDLRLFALPDEAVDDEDDFEPEDAPPVVMTDDVAHFPEFDVGPYHGATPDRKLTMRRLATLHALTRDLPPRFTVTSARAAARRTVPRSEMERYSRTFTFGDSVPNEELRHYLVLCGFTEAEVVEDPGTFAVRGDIIDIFPPSGKHPYRFERWGDEISEIRTFDAATQRTVREVEECHVFPVREEVLDEQNIERARKEARALADERSIPTRAMTNILADLEAGLHFIGIDALLPAIYGELEDVYAYVPEDAIVVLIDPDTVLDEARELLDKRADEYGRVVLEEGMVAYSPHHYYRADRDVYKWATTSRTRVELRRVAVEHGDVDMVTFSLPPEEQRFEFRARLNSDVVRLRKEHRVADQTIKALAFKLQKWKEQYGRICFACRTRGQVERLEQLLQNSGEDAFPLPTPIDVSEPVPPPAGVIEIYRADVSEGFRSQLLSVAIIAGNEVFGQRVAMKATKSFAEHVEISHFRDLSPGDYLVHVDFGIGRYHGLVRLELEGISNDFLHIEYADGDKLYLPVYRLGRVQKYIGATDGVRLDKLGGTGWERTKERVKENIRAIAGDLLKLYAKRELQRGYAFTPPDAYYREFEDAFPYEETPDQARAIEETISDMVSERPMDRLICGDVGFGKTEVAIRAAMKAVMDGKQVAVLVPTTILCEQHVISFKQRCAEFGARVEGLSRFRSGKESREILEGVASGKVDIVVGTHRLLSQDVEFRDLGLLVVDEEQRFGVKHKDKIKEFKNAIDVLTLTATPIPRTLQMSMLGIRDLSIIATPPHERLSVRTHVARLNDSLVREAVMRELSRGGQVFFVHNRVQTIDEMAEHLERVVPEARVSVAHGQMSEGPLEDVMYSYLAGDTNVLLCTSIIESGLDIPNANTIIVNRADHFGLSQLYQLRGRVGRGKERAYAYFLIPARRKLKADAEKRLEVIQTYTELGSGFQVASYDLEIRGAGNLLGENQSGHVASVGLDLYTELLEEAINDLRGQDLEGEIEPEVNIPVEAYIPEEYIPATSLRLMFYKRFSLAQSTEELFDTYGEMGDRFGDAPESVRNLRDIIALKVGLRQLRGRRMDAGPAALSIELDPSTPLDPSVIIDYMRESRGKVRLTEQMKLIYKLKPDESARPLKTSREWIEQLLELV